MALHFKFWFQVMDAIRQRHQQWKSESQKSNHGGGGVEAVDGGNAGDKPATTSRSSGQRDEVGVKLKFWLHTDSTKSERAFRDHADSDVAVFGPGAKPLPFVINQLVQADLLVMSRSGLSVSCALIGNRTAIIPSCFNSRHPLPHWIHGTCNRVAEWTQQQWETAPMSDFAPNDHTSVLRMSWPP